MITGQNILFDKFSTFFSLGLKQPDLLFLLASSTREHKHVESMYKQMLGRFHSGENATFPNRDLNTFKYFEHNFFSILFLSLFKVLGIPTERRLNYGVIIHAIRTVVTCTDNILDNENKGAVFLNLGLNNTVLDNVILSLLSQNIVGRALKNISDDEDIAEQAEEQILDSLSSIAKGESLTAAGSLDPLPEPEDIIENIHKKIGGELLRLALIAPLKNEIQLQPQLKLVESGILSIGIGLQMLDDVVDFQEDIIVNKTNLLASWIIYKEDNGYTYQALKDIANSEETDVQNLFYTSQMEIINAAIGRALDGFDRFASVGYPINRAAAISVVKTMFKLRGLEKEWQKSNFA